MDFLRSLIPRHEGRIQLYFTIQDNLNHVTSLFPHGRDLTDFGDIAFISKSIYEQGLSISQAPKDTKVGNTTYWSTDVRQPVRRNMIQYDSARTMFDRKGCMAIKVIGEVELTWRMTEKHKDKLLMSTFMVTDDLDPGFELGLGRRHEPKTLFEVPPSLISSWDLLKARLRHQEIDEGQSRERKPQDILEGHREQDTRGRSRIPRS